MTKRAAPASARMMFMVSPCCTRRDGGQALRPGLRAGCRAGPIPATGLSLRPRWLRAWRRRIGFLPAPVKVNDSPGHPASPEPVAPTDPATLVPREPFAPGRRAWWQNWRVMVVVWLIIIGFVWMAHERHVDKSVIAA